MVKPLVIKKQFRYLQCRGTTNGPGRFPVNMQDNGNN